MRLLSPRARCFRDTPRQHARQARAAGRSELRGARALGRADLAAWLGARPIVAGVQRYGRARLHLDGHAVELGFTDFHAAEAARYGMVRRLSGNEAIVSEQLARKLGLATGDRLAVGDGMRVAGVFRGYGDAGLRMLVDDAGSGSSFQIVGQALPAPIRLAHPVSTGTLEQAYLSLRLAIVDHLDRGGERLPLFVDEVFVNWDQERRARGA